MVFEWCWQTFGSSGAGGHCPQPSPFSSMATLPSNYKRHGALGLRPENHWFHWLSFKMNIPGFPKVVSPMATWLHGCRLYGDQPAGNKQIGGKRVRS